MLPNTPLNSNKTNHHPRANFNPHLQECVPHPRNHPDLSLNNRPNFTLNNPSLNPLCNKWEWEHPNHPAVMHPTLNNNNSNSTSRITANQPNLKNALIIRYKLQNGFCD